MPPKKLTPAEWVLAIRNSHQLTQEKFAALIGRDRSAVAKWETEVARPRYDSIQKLKLVAPPELRDVGLIQDESIPEEDGESFDATPTTASLIRALDSWADAAGVKRPTEDNDFLDQILAAYTEYRRRAAKGMPK